jgi:hypothetical protein
MSLPGILTWVVVVLMALAVAGELRPLVIGRGRAGRPRVGAHARPVLAEPGERRQAWHRVRLVLLVASGLLAAPLSESRDHATRWLAGSAIALIVICEFRSWLGLADPGARKTARQESRWLLLAAMSSAYELARGWQYDTLWWLTAVTLLILAPDIDSWLRARISRASGDPTIEPPT